MKNLIFLLIAAVFTFAGCKKDNAQTEPAAPDAEPVVPATLAEVDSLLKGRWKFVKGIGKYSLGTDTVYTRVWEDSIYEAYTKNRRHVGYMIVNGETKYQAVLAYGVSDYPLNYLPQNYKYSIAFYFRPYTKQLQIMKLTKTTLITVDLERLDYPAAPVVPADRQTVIHEFRRMSPMEESLFSPDI
jgi:hypothetical protein